MISVSSARPVSRGAFRAMDLFQSFWGVFILWNFDASREMFWALTPSLFLISANVRFPSIQQWWQKGNQKTSITLNSKTNLLPKDSSPSRLKETNGSAHRVGNVITVSSACLVWRVSFRFRLCGACWNISVSGKLTPTNLFKQLERNYDYYLLK